MRRTIKKIFSSINADLPGHIKKMRKEAGYTQKQLADKMPGDVSQATISNWESGKTSVGFAELITVCIICGQSPKMFVPEVLEENGLNYDKERRSD